MLLRLSIHTSNAIQQLFSTLSKLDAAHQPEIGHWQPTLSASVDMFEALFNSIGANATRYPITSVCLRERKTLPHVASLSYILAWHRVLFEVFPDSCISREEAARLTNGDVIDMLPEHRKEHGSNVLAHFCQVHQLSFFLSLDFQYHKTFKFLFLCLHCSSLSA